MAIQEVGMSNIYDCVFQAGDTLTMYVTGGGAKTQNVAFLQIKEKDWKDVVDAEELQSDLVDDGAQVGLSLRDVRDLHDKLGKIIKEIEINSLLK